MWANLPASKVEQITSISWVEIITYVKIRLHSFTYNKRPRECNCYPALHRFHECQHSNRQIALCASVVLYFLQTVVQCKLHCLWFSCAGFCLHWNGDVASIGVVSAIVWNILLHFLGRRLVNWRVNFRNSRLPCCRESMIETKKYIDFEIK